MKKIFENHKICAILRDIPLEKTMSYVATAITGGIRIFEVALNSQDALKQITMIREKWGNQIKVGAGTAITKKLVAEAKAVGAEFVLTPSTSIEVLEYCRVEKIPLLPGVMTPTDVGNCVAYGYQLLKLFPAGYLPNGYMKSLQGPFEQTQYIAVGGVNPQNVQRFLESGFYGVGIATSLIPKECIEKNEWEKAMQGIKEMVDCVERTKRSNEN